MSDLPYPSPSYSAHIWTSGDTIILGLPPSEGKTQGNSIVLPATTVGLTAILQILRDREHSRHPLIIDLPGVPTQELAKALAKTNVRPFRQELPSDPEDAIAELDL